MLRTLALLILCFVIVSLIWALISLLRNRGEGDTTRTVRALTWRIGAALFLFLLIVVSASLGVFPN